MNSLKFTRNGPPVPLGALAVELPSAPESGRPIKQRVVDKQYFVLTEPERVLVDGVHAHRRDLGAPVEPCADVERVARLVLDLVVLL